MQTSLDFPEHLAAYVADQAYDRYTPIDHASWRYILRITQDFSEDNAHGKYLDGLREAGIVSERIPRLEEMNDCLGQFGWRAVAVSGFIPPQVFMEFQSLGVMPIACDMRKHEHITYTPAPDIVHEAAGHAPLVADPDYRAYLRDYGEVSRKAIFSHEDLELYDAIRNLSEVKEDPAASDDDVAEAQRLFEHKAASISYVSEASHLSRMYWWTVEYGLVGPLDAPQIYGAGLLSSIGESYRCLGDGVRHLPLTVDCVEQGFDITRPQPQLFVTPDFPTLSAVLDEYADRMAFRVGGLAALRKARRAGTVTTTVLDSGLQISGVLTEVFTDPAGRPFFARWGEGVQLAQGDVQLDGHGADFHAHGFSSPIGRLTDGTLPGELDTAALTALGFGGDDVGTLRFESGVVLTGRLTGRTTGAGGALLLTFEGCTVQLGDEILFQPDWGVFDLACGERVPSVFGGAADRACYATTRPPRELPLQKTNFVEREAELCALYGEVRALREAEVDDAELTVRLGEVAAVLSQRWSGDWLLRLELLELCRSRSLEPPFVGRLQQELAAIAGRDEVLAEVIERGMALI
jgi:phenylalanine-4-hydroxylase